MTDRYRVTHNSERVLWLEELWQYRTHRGLMMGQPTREMNQDEVIRTVQTAQDRYGTVARIQPVERVLDVSPDDVELLELLQHVPKLHPVEIPWTTCIGLFRSYPPARDPKKDHSYLTIVWYQDQFALPIAPMELSQIQALDWTTLAADAAAD